VHEWEEAEMLASASTYNTAAGFQVRALALSDWWEGPCSMTWQDRGYGVPEVFSSGESSSFRWQRWTPRFPFLGFSSFSPVNCHFHTARLF